MILPNFLVIGAPKAGTTALYHYLKEHPQVFMSPIKEPKFFALEGERVDFQGPHDYKKDYVTDINAYHTLFKDVSDESAIGEVSPWYLYLPKTAERINHYIPNTKLITILRDPVERAYSHFSSLVSKDHEPLTDFTQAMEAEEMRMRNNWSPRWHYKQRGFYYSQIKRYFNLFDQSQIKIYLYEDFKANPIGVLQDIFRFIEVDDEFAPNISQKHHVTYMRRNEVLHKFFVEENLAKSILKPLISSNLRQCVKANLINLNIRKRPKLQPEVRKRFIEVYREDILNLQGLIQRDLSAWLEV
ncbi:MAG: sulfotransferase [Leptolyngbyaceae cyanobacterium MO_188.B28]|nr:sulfotransferase [Leptolyngbyaceae cyanobacterium MO_188.B28]